MKRYIRLIILLGIVFLFKSEVYAYTEYKVGDVVPYNDMEFYVIKDSSKDEDSVTLLKAEPLTVEEVNLYGGVGTENNHVNRHTSSLMGTASNENGYGGMQYYSSDFCGFDSNSNWLGGGCTTDYTSSEIKYVVDAWKTEKISDATEARLITYEELCELGEKKYNKTPSGTYEYIELQYDWLYNNNYWYWTMSQYQDSVADVWSVRYDGDIGFNHVNTLNDVVRPVITLKKTFLGDADESIIDDNSESDKQENTSKVEVANTYMKVSLIIIILGFILACASVAIYYIIKKKGSNE